jgi:hypothetical protein
MKLKLAIAFLTIFVVSQPTLATGSNSSVSSGGPGSSDSNDPAANAINPLEKMFDNNKQYLTDWSPVQKSTQSAKTLPDQPIPAWDTEVNVAGSMEGQSLIHNPLNTAPEPFWVHDLNMTFQNYDKNLMDVLFMQAQRFNTSLNDTDLFSLNNRVYAFAWRNGLFERMPFPVNSTFPFSNTDQKDCPVVLTPLKNRFAARPLQPKQMECSLNVRVLEANHYLGKFNRIILQFFSPCMDYPITRYLLNKAGLRASLVLRLLGQSFRFEFERSYRTKVGSSETEAFRQYRHVHPHHHRAIFVGRRYKADNRTQFTTVMAKKTWTPETLFGMQATVLESLDRQYRTRLNLTDQMEQNREFTPRNERFPRKAVDNSKPSHKKGSKSKATKKNRKDGKGVHHEHLSSSPQDFRFPAHEVKRNRRLAAKLMGGEEALDRFLQQRYNFETWSVNPGSPGYMYRNHNTGKWWGHYNGNQAGYRQNWYQMGEGTLLNSLLPVLQTIRANEPYKVSTCQRICTMKEYYHSWNFCLRVCGINYNFLSNVRPLPGTKDFFPKVPWVRVASGLIPLIRRDKPTLEQWTVDHIKSLWDKPQVYSCQQSWSQFTCDL